jgi:hypothetical protein
MLPARTSIRSALAVFAMYKQNTNRMITLEKRLDLQVLLCVIILTVSFFYIPEYNRWRRFIARGMIIIRDVGKAARLWQQSSLVGIQSENEAPAFMMP